MFRRIVLVGVLVWQPALAQQPSGMFRGGATHAGRYGGGGNTIVGLQWRVPTDGEISSTPLVVGDAVYVGSDNGSVLALDRLTGKTRWSYRAGSAVSSSPAAGNGLLFVASRDGVMHAISAATGKPVWRYRTGPLLPFPWGHESGDFYVSSAAFVNGVVYFGAGDGTVNALDALTGKVRWRASTEGRVRGTPAVANGRVFVGSFDGRVYAFDAATGGLKWRYETEGAGLNSGNFGFDRRSIQSSPAVDGGVVFVGARDGFLYAIDANDGSLKWRVDHKVSWINSSPAVADGVVFAGSSDGHFLQAVDAATGTERWRAPTGTAIVWSSPAVAGRWVYFGDGAGFLHVVDRDAGNEVARFGTGAGIFSSPVVDGSLLFVGSGDGAVYGLRLAEGDSVRRAVFFDSTYTSVSTIPNPGNLPRYLAGRGYAALDGAGLVRFLEARVADRAASVVVFALDALPPDAAGQPLDRSLLRRYLDSGGKVVWSGLPPMFWPVPPGGRRTGLSEIHWVAPDSLLGVPHQETIFDARMVRATEAGRRWGLPASWRSAWGIAPSGVSEVLGLDDWGLASSWVKRYTGPPGTGFVRMDFSDPLAVYLAAEYRPLP